MWKWDGSNAQPATRKSGRAGQGKLRRMTGQGRTATGQVCGVNRETETMGSLMDTDTE